MTNKELQWRVIQTHKIKDGVMKQVEGRTAKMEIGPEQRDSDHTVAVTAVS